MDFERLEHKYRRFLSANGMFYTRERKALLRVLSEKKGHFSVEEISRILEEQDISISRATLYRTLTQMTQAHVLTEADFGHGHAHYEICVDNRDFHAHFICNDCGEIFEFKDSSFGELIKKLAYDRKIKVECYNMQINGLCSNCNK